ncbi:MAG: L-threonylcarbamoyladenylate synthase [Treponema sp.]|nr:L-threonylcarbamoyladenylate synthase [Treponema sp.]
MICHKSDDLSIKKVVDCLKNGDIVVLPTDTVYGFSGIVDSLHNCDKKIRLIKGRSESKPFIQLISSPEKLQNYTNDIVPQSLLDKWPGPLTIIVKDLRFSSGDSVVKTAFRCPGDEWLRKILSEIDQPLYSTSLNRTGQPVLDEEAAIISEFKDEVPLIVLDGDKKNALPSTIVEFNGSEIKIIRQGSVKI